MADKHINKRWTDKEVEILKKLYPKGGYREVKKLLPHRTSRAISEKSRSLGIFSNSRQKYFSEDTYFEIAK